MSAEIILRCVIQRTKNAEVVIDGVSQGKIEKGLVIFFGVGLVNKTIDPPVKPGDDSASSGDKRMQHALEKLADKIISLRIFSDSDGKMNLSVKDTNGGIYLISQFTLFADCRKGNRPSFTASAKPDLAKPVYELFLEILRKKCSNISVLSGIFAADMQVNLCNDGPVTILMDTPIALG